MMTCHVAMCPRFTDPRFCVVCPCFSQLTTIKMSCFERGGDMLAMLHVQRKRLKPLQPQDVASAQHAGGLDVLLCPQGVHAVLKYPRPSQLASLNGNGAGGVGGGVGGGGDDASSGMGVGGGEAGGGESGGNDSVADNVLIELDGNMVVYPKRQVMRLIPAEFPATVFLDHVWMGSGVRSFSSTSRQSAPAASLWALHSFITSPKGGFADYNTYVKIQRPFPGYWVFGGIPSHVIRLLTRSRRANASGMSTGVNTPIAGVSGTSRIVGLEQQAAKIDTLPPSAQSAAESAVPPAPVAAPKAAARKGGTKRKAAAAAGANTPGADDIMVQTPSASAAAKKGKKGSGAGVLEIDGVDDGAAGRGVAPVAAAANKKGGKKATQRKAKGGKSIQKTAEGPGRGFVENAIDDWIADGRINSHVGHFTLWRRRRCSLSSLFFFL